MTWLEMAVGGHRHPLLGDPGARARSILGHPDVALVASSTRLSPVYAPDLLTPKPESGSWFSALRGQLEAIRETPSTAVNTQLLFAQPKLEAMPVAVRRAIESEAFARRAANGLHLFFRAAMADRWRALEDAVSADIARRARTIVTHGIGRTLGSLHRDATWTGDELHINKPFDYVTELTDDDLVLAPSVLTWPTLRTQVWDPDDAVVVYPVGPPEAERRGEGLASLVGTSRAEILRDLSRPTSTTKLAAKHGLAVSTVSHHLGVLLGAGLVVKERKGAVVEYRRTEGGDELIDRAV